MSDLDALRQNAPDLFGDVDMDALRQNAPDLFGDAASVEITAPWWDLWSPLVERLVPVPQTPSSSVFNPFGALVAAAEYRDRVARRIEIVATARTVGAVHTWLLRPLGGALGALHGRGRYGSTRSAVLWAALGAAFPLLTTTTAVAQGFARARTTRGAGSSGRRHVADPMA